MILLITIPPIYFPKIHLQYLFIKATKIWSIIFVKINIINLIKNKIEYHANSKEFKEKLECDIEGIYIETDRCSVNEEELAKGGAVCFLDGQIKEELPVGKEGVLMVQVWWIVVTFLDVCNLSFLNSFVTIGSRKCEKINIQGKKGMYVNGFPISKTY